ncbi:MAG: cysteine ABC transporter ATP-binding protein [Clostridiales bacterium]|nr:MAG: cysteine ABC transporter ATP-binding protein [Clostridiales bacterium]
MIDKRLMGLVPESNKHIVKAVVLKIVSLFCNVAIAFAMADFLANLIAAKPVDKSILLVLAVVVVAGLARYVLTAEFAQQSHLASTLVKKRLRRLIFEKILKLGNGYSESISTAEVIQASVEGVNQLELYFGLYLPQFFYAMIAPLILFAILSFYSFKTALVLFICVPLIPISIALVQKIAKKILSKYWGQYTQLGDDFLENIQGLTTLKIYRADQKKHEAMNASAERFRVATMRVLKMQLNSIIVMDIIAYGGAALGILLTLLDLQAGRLNAFGVLLFIFLSAEFFLPMRRLGSFFHVAMNGIAASKTIFKLLDTPVERVASKTEVGGDIVLKNMSYSYDDVKEVLQNIDMCFAENSFCSVVGESGSGKSTIAKIIKRSIHNYRGNGKIGDIEISDISEDALNQDVVLVGMNAHVFKGTVKENLLMGRADATDEMLWQALEKVNLANFLKTLDGLDTVLQEGGSNFSGGQRQRLALARALLRDAKIYIFDEATSNIDVESENKILDVLQELKLTKTVIMISHRLANVVKADMIYVLEMGKQMGAGQHEALLDSCPTYNHLWHTQKELEAYAGGHNEQ